MTRKRALITGVTGQDGSYLAEHLISEDYEVFGMVRRSSVERLQRIEHLAPRLQLVEGDLLDQTSLVRVLSETRPDEIYNLGAQSFVPASWQEPVLTAEATALGVTRLLESVRQVCPTTRFFQASSSEMFGKVRESPQNEQTAFHPRSPYGVAKVFAHHATVNYRESYGLYTCSGILFNHESPRRGREFVTRKITLGAARIAHGQERELCLGNLDARRDWGFAGDTVRAMWLMLQQDEPRDYVIATGVMHSVRDVCQVAFESLGLDWTEHVRTDPSLFRPAEVERLCGDATRARQELGWEPEIGFRSLVESMAASDYRTLAGELAARRDTGALGFADANTGAAPLR